MTAKVWVMQKAFRGMPKTTDFAVVEETLKPIQNGEFLAEAVVWSVDPYSRIVESKNAEFTVGQYVVAQFGWRTLTISDGAEVHLLPDLAGLELSASVGVLGMPGATAYFGLLECCKPKPGETVLINSAAGAVGSVVGQIAKILGCKTIGYAGSDEKVAWLKELGFDHAFNYKTADLDESIKEAAPNGVDCYFDNVGGEFSLKVYNHMNEYGRICQCGCIASYNDEQVKLLPSPLSVVLAKQLRLNGFLVFSYLKARTQEYFSQISQWLHQGKIKHKETTYSGFEKMPQALIDQMSGKVMGKVVVKAV